MIQLHLLFWVNWNLLDFWPAWKCRNEWVDLELTKKTKGKRKVQTTVRVSYLTSESHKIAILVTHARKLFFSKCLFRYFSVSTEQLPDMRRTHARGEGNWTRVLLHFITLFTWHALSEKVPLVTCTEMSKYCNNSGVLHSAFRGSQLRNCFCCHNVCTGVVALNLCLHPIYASMHRFLRACWQTRVAPARFAWIGLRF